MRKTVTIPAAGKTLTVSMTGRSVIVESMGTYPSIDDVPTMQLSPGISDYPLYPRSVYPNSEEFQQIVITGTAESAGDKITLLSTGQCLDLALNIVFSGSYEAVAGTSFTVTSTDAAQSLSEIQLQDAAGNLPKSIVVSALDNPIIYAFNVAPDRSTDLGHILHKNVITGGSEFNGSLLEIEGIDFILNWQFASAAAGSPAVLTVTPRY